MKPSTKHPTPEQLDVIRSKFAMMGPRYIYDIDLKESTEQGMRWINLWLLNTETNKRYTLCAGDYDWIMTPWKIESHLFGTALEIGEQGIFDTYICTKKPL